MKTTVKRITALFLVLLMTASLLASCSWGGESEDAVTEVDGIPVFDQYKSRKVDLGLSENETLFDIIEVDGELRATVGVLDPNWDPDHPEEYIGLPYLTEHRWYSLDYAEDTTKREKTVAYHEITFPADPNVDFVFGGEPMEDEYGKGIVYHLYRKGEIQDDVLVEPLMLEEQGGIVYAKNYNAMAHVMVYEDVPFASMHYGETRTDGTYRYEGASIEELYINHHFVNIYNRKPEYPEYVFRGLIGVRGLPYALLEIKNKGCLVPLTTETTEIMPEGIEIDGCPTGGAFTDGRFGYFMSGTELWRTDGKESKCLIDLVPHGVTLASMVRSVRTLPDGRLLVSVDGNLIELSESDGNDTVTICDIGVIDYHGDDQAVDDLNLLISRYNDQAKRIFFRVKEYEDVGILNMAVLSGDVDLLITSNRLTLNNYIKQDLLVALEEVAPKLFEKDVLIESVVDATRVDGTCYYLPLNFEICGESVYDPSLLKDGKLFVTREEYYNYITENDLEYFKNQTPSQILDVFARDLDEWIDWENNTCHFDDGTFAALLELCERGSTQEEINEYWSELNEQSTLNSWWGHRQKASSFTLKDAVESYRFTDAKKATEYQETLPVVDYIGGPTTWVELDFPMPSRIHEGYEIDAHNLYAIVDHEDSKAACADLLQWIILEDVEEEFPENNSDPFYARGWDGLPSTRTRPTDICTAW